MLPALNEIEWQLCMRMLSHRDGLAFALCSRATLRAASAPFAWSASEVTYDSAALPSLLLRFAPIHLRWRPLVMFTDHCSAADVDALLSSPLRVSHLDASAFASVSATLWCRVLRSRWAQQLRVLTLNKGPSRFQPVSSLVWPLLGLELRSLSLGALRVTELQASPSPHAFPHLTSLHFDASSPNTLQLFAHCPIRHATLIRTSETELEAFLRSRSGSGLHTLESLRLESASLTEGPLTSVLCDLRSLRTLHLVRVRLVNDAMRDLQMRSAIERVIIEPGRPASHAAFLPTLPSLRSLCDQLAESPRLLFTFRMDAQQDGSLSDRCAGYLAGIDPAVRHHITIEAVPCPRFSKRGPIRECDESVLQRQRPSQPLNPHAAESDARRWVGPLPTDLMRLVFAHLPAVDRFVLARCSPWTVRIADSPISWMHAMLPVDVTDLADRLHKDGPVHAPGPSHPQRFSRHCPLSLHWPASPGPYRTLAYHGRVIRLLQREPNLLVHRLDCTELRGQAFRSINVCLLLWWPICWRWMRRYERVLARPALRRVRSVTICEPIDASVMRRLSSLACLESLSVALPRSLLRDAPSADWVAIFASGFRALRHLRVKATVSVSMLLPLFEQLPQLERLELIHCPWSDTDLSTLTTHTVLSGNPRLSISLLSMEPRDTAPGDDV